MPRKNRRASCWRVNDVRLQRLERAIAQTAVVTRGRPSTGLRHDAAAEDRGTVDTDDACGFDPFQVLRVMDLAGVPVVVIGQVAGILHGSQELTGDLDLLWSGNAHDSARLAVAFAQLGAELRNDAGELLCLTGAVLPAKVDFRTASACGDVCTPDLSWGALPVQHYLGDHEIVTCPDGTVIRYVRREALIAMRRAVGRPKDLRRAAELESLACT